MNGARWGALLLVVVVGCGDDGSGGEDAAVAPDGSVERDLGGEADAFVGDGSLGDAFVPSDAFVDGDGGAAEGCRYVELVRRDGVFHTPTAESPQHIERPLGAGEGFFCLRVSFTMELGTWAELEATGDSYEGCSIFSHVVTAEGTGPEARVMGTGYWRFIRVVGCTRKRPGTLENNVWSPDGTNRGGSDTGPWLPGETYRITLTVEPFTSTLEVRDLEGNLVGPAVVGDISGSTVAMTRDAHVTFGLDRIHENAFFPYFGSVYSDLIIEASVAPAM